MFEKFKATAKRLNDWLSTPVVAAKRMNRRFFIQALRSRFFLLCAILTALPLLLSASAMTWKAEKDWLTTSEIGWLLWLNAILSWVLFILTAAFNHRKLTRRARRNQK